MKIRMSKLRSMLSEQAISRLLNEEHLREEDDSMAHESGISGKSIDSQVDRFLSEYETAAKKTDVTDGPDASQMESIDWRDLIRGYVINEAGEGDKDDETPDDSAPGADDITDADDKPGIESLDVEKFANDVVRLIQNYDSLLEIRSCIIRRATDFLGGTYNEELVEAFKDTLRDDHGMEAGHDKGDINADKFPSPAADRANGSAEPGVGGGGGAGV